ncbi:effector binding domain-containing protein [Paenibacillus puldeungensis]|uniref:Effector binding domain-containing protein n=1 Tax=Paenibacillus puldeungensis TaxID=696536 RepID=A0ABW3RVR2_9BACL
MDSLKAIEKAIMYIENHLSEDIGVEDAARAAGYSYYHLTRQFTALLGESIGSYIKKRRLADGAQKLLYTDKRVIDIALDHGFESSEAFSRAFKAMYKMSPHTYRKNRLDLMIGAKQKMEPELLNHLIHNITVHPQIVEMPQTRVAGLRGQTTLRDNVLPELWQQFNAISQSIPEVKPRGRGFGICEACQEDNSLYMMNNDVLFSEVVGVEVENFDRLPEPFVAKSLPGGRYAVFTHTGSLARLPRTFQYIWGTWFFSTKEELDGSREDFELYDERFIGYHHPESQIDIYIPVK